MKQVLLKILRWLGILILGLIVILMVGIELFDRYLATEKGARWIFKNVPAPMEIRFTASGVRYVSIGDPKKPPLLLIHGAPGSLFDWSRFVRRPELYEHYHVLVVERPGYGATRPRRAEPSIQVQAERILEVLAGERQPAVVMGHSYGGPIAVVMAALQPEKIARVIGVSGQYDPDDEITFKISYFINFKLFKFLLPRFIWSSNVEKLTHPAALREVLPLYQQVRVPVELIHGDADTLVPYNNSPFLLHLLPGRAELITLPGKDHPIHMTEADYLVDYVLKTSGNPGQGQ